MAEPQVVGKIVYIDGNVYVNNSYNADTTGTTHSITGEELKYGTTLNDILAGANAFSTSQDGSKKWIVIEGYTVMPMQQKYTMYIENFNFSGNSLYFDGSHNLYVDGLVSNYLYPYPKSTKVSKQFRADEGSQPFKVVVKNSTLDTTAAGPGGVWMFGANNSDVEVYVDVDLTISGSTMRSFSPGIGMGENNTDVKGKMYGNITFDVSDTIIKAEDERDVYVTKGQVGTSEKSVKVTGSLTNVTFTNRSFRGIRNAGGYNVYADFDLTITHSTTVADFVLGYTQADAEWNGVNTMTVYGSTAARFNAFSNARSAGTNQFNLIIGADEKQTVATSTDNTSIERWDNITVKAGASLQANAITLADQEDTTSKFVIEAGAVVNAGAITAIDGILTIEAGANVTATSIDLGDEGVLNLGLGATLNVGTITVGEFNVIGELTEPDTIIATGVTSITIDSDYILVGGREYEEGVFPGYYEVSGGNLILHNATSTVFLVNSNYNNGEKTDLGPKGYETVAAAQAAVDPAKKDTTTIMIYGMDDEVDPSDFEDDIVTKDFTTSIVGESSNTIDLQGNSIVIGDTEGNVASANLSASYLKGVDTISFGDIDGTATVSLDRTTAKTLDMTGSVIADAQVTVTNGKITDLKLADQEGSTGKLTVSNTTITNVYAGESGIEADLSGGNSITDVYAEGQGASIKLGTSTVENYIAGKSEAGSEIDELVYNDTVTATNLIIGGNENTIGSIKATIAGGEVENLQFGGDDDTITGNVDAVFSGGLVSNVKFSNGIEGKANVTFSGGTVAALDKNTGAITTAYDDSAMFYGIIYGASVTGAIDGGEVGGEVHVEGNAKIGALKNFETLVVTGGTLNVASANTTTQGDTIVTDKNTIDISGLILNRRGINAASITAGSLENYGQIGVLRRPDKDEDGNLIDDAGIALEGSLYNEGYIKTSVLSVGGDFYNSGKVTAVGDITVDGEGTFVNKGQLFFRSTFDLKGQFAQEGGLTLNGVDLENSGFFSAGYVKGIEDLTTTNMYVTGGVEVAGNLTVLAGSEVAFTNKANPDLADGLVLGGSIELWDTSNLVVSGDLSSNDQTITINVGDLIGSNEVVRAEGGVNEWKVTLAGDKAGLYTYTQTETSVIVYSLDEIFVNSAWSADKKVVVDNNVLVYGINAFSSVEDAIAGAADGSVIVIYNDDTGMDIDAAGKTIALHNSTVGDVTAGDILITDDSTIDNIVSANSLAIEADAALSLTGTMPSDMAIVIDADEGSGSRFLLDVDPTVATINLDNVTVLSPEGKAYTADLIADGDFAGDLILKSVDKVYILKDMTVFDGQTGYLSDAATGDILIKGYNTFGLDEREAAEAIVTENDGVLHLVGFTTADGLHVTPGVTTAFEFAKGDGSTTLHLFEGDTFEGSLTNILEGGQLNANETIYGLGTYINTTGDYTFIAKDVHQDLTYYGGASWEGNAYTNTMYLGATDHTSVMDGNYTVQITDSAVPSIYLGAGSFGTDETKPIDVNVLVENSTIGHFYGIITQPDNTDPSKSQKINANLDIKIYDSIVGGTFTILNSNNDHWNANGATLLQTYFTAGSINVEIAGSTFWRNLRVGTSLEMGGKAIQAFNIPSTLHVMRTEDKEVTYCSYIDEWDTVIVDATAQLQATKIQYTTIGINHDTNGSLLDNAGTLTQVLINMSGYGSGTHTVITTTEGINTDKFMTNISVIGDNDPTGQCQLAYDVTVVDEETGEVDPGSLRKIIVFDKSDDMYVNSTYTSSINGWHEEYQQELLYTYNAHKSFEKALVYADEWHGDIVVTGGTFGDQDFHGNNVVIFAGTTFGNISLATEEQCWDDATITVNAGATIASIDGSDNYIGGTSTLELLGNAKVGDISNFTAITVDKGAELTLGDVSTSNIAIYADNKITADSLDLNGVTLTIDVTGYVGAPHVVVGTTDGITLGSGKIELVGTDADKYGYTILDGKDLVLTTTIPSDTYLNSTYSTSTTGTILDNGTYLEYGFNAFSEADKAIAGLGGLKNVLTVTGGEIDGNLHMQGKSIVVEEGALSGIIYGCDDDDFNGMTVTVKSGSIGGIDLTGGEGAYSVNKATITLGDGVTVNGSIIGGTFNDTVLNLGGDVTVTGGLEDLATITISTDSFLDANYIELTNGTLYVTGTSFQAEEGNRRKLVTTKSGINGVTLKNDPGIKVYQEGNDIYLVDLSRIYFDPSYNEDTTGTTAATGDTLFYGENAFNDASAALKALVTGGTLFANNWPASADIIPGKVVSIIAKGDGGRFAVVAGGAPTTITDDVVIDISNIEGFKNSNNYGGGTRAIIAGQGDGANQLNFAGDLTVNIAGSGRLNQEDAQYDDDLAITRYVQFTGRPDAAEGEEQETQKVTVTIDGSTGAYLNRNTAFFRQVGTGDFDAKNLTVEVNLNNLNCPSDRWLYFFSGNDNPGSDANVSAKDAVLNLNNTYLRASGQNWSVSLVSSGANSRDTNFSVHLTGSTVDGIISGVRDRAQNAPGTTSEYGGTRTLYVDGGVNQLARAVMFNNIVVNANASLILTNATGSYGNNVAKPVQFLANRTGSSDARGLVAKDSITIDFEGYEGGDKMLIQASEFYYGRSDNNSGRTLTASDFGDIDDDNVYVGIIAKNDDEGKYVIGVGASRGIFVIAKGGDVIYNPNYSDADNGTAAADTFVLYNDEDNPNGNAFDDMDDAKAAINQRGKDRTIIVTGIDDDEADEFYTDGYKMNLTNGKFAKVFGTDEDGDGVKSVDLTISGGSFASVVMAEEDVDVTNDATLTITGGTFGAPGQPPAEEGDDPTPATLATISGSKDDVGGVSTLNLANTSKIYAAISDFDAMTVTTGAGIEGSVSVDAFAVDCGTTLTITGTLATGSIHLISADYEGPSKKVLTADNLAEIIAGGTTVYADGEDKYFLDTASNTLWLVSGDPGNIYVDASFDETINGTIIGEDLLYFGVNAFNSIESAVLSQAVTSDYTLYVLGGTLAGGDLSGVGQVNVQIDGGTIANLVVANGEENRSTVRITGNSEAVVLSNVSGAEGDTLGYRLIANKDASIGTVDGAGYLRVAAGTGVTVGTVNFLESLDAAELVIDMAGYTAGAGVVLQTTGGINNFMKYITPEEGEAYSQTIVGVQNNASNLMLYYDESKKAVIAAESGNFGIISGDYNDSVNGTTIERDGKSITAVYGYNVGFSASTISSYVADGGTLYVENVNRELMVQNKDFNAVITNSTLGATQLGKTSTSSNKYVRTGDVSISVSGTTFTGQTAFFGRGDSESNRATLVVGTLNEGDIVDGVYNITFDAIETIDPESGEVVLNKSRHNDNGFRLTQNAQIAGGVVNVTFNDYDLRGDLQLFDNVWNYNGKELKQVNVTMNNLTAPASKWMWIWDAREANATEINLTIKDSTFVGNDHTLGLFGNNNTGWNGVANVYLDNVTMSEGRLSGQKGTNNGGDNPDQGAAGSRILHVVGGTNNIGLVKQFTQIEIADGALLTGSTISMGADADEVAFILRGTKGYEGEVKEYAVVVDSGTNAATIAGASQTAAAFLDEDGKAIDGYTAIVGSTNVFIYKKTGDVYYNQSYEATITGKAITEADGSKNFLVYGDNAVTSTKDAFASLAIREDATLFIEDIGAMTLYTKGYNTVVSGGFINNIYGGNAPTTVDEEPVAAENVKQASITIVKGATIGNVTVATELSQVTEDATITIGDGAAISGVIDGGYEFVGGESSLVFEGYASAKSVANFDEVTIQADGLVTLSDVFASDSITIDCTGFNDFTKKVLVAEGGFGEEKPDVSLIGNEEGKFSYQFLDDGKTLVVTSTLVKDTYANTDWTPDDVKDKFVGETLLVWDGNAFNTIAGAAGALQNAENVLHIEGGTSSESVMLALNNNVIVSANTAGTQIGSLTSSGTLTVEGTLSAQNLNEFSAISAKAAALTVSGGISLADEKSTITIDMTGYKLAEGETDGVVLSTGTGIENFTRDQLKFVGDGAGAFYGYYSEEDGDIHAMRIDNYYEDVSWGEHGENFVEGSINPITGEALFWGVNAFFYLNDILSRLTEGQGLYIANRNNNVIDNGIQVSDLNITNSTVGTLINGYTAGNGTYVGDLSVTITDSTIATGGESTLVCSAPDYQNPNRVYGNITVEIENSTLGSVDAAQTLHLYNFTHVYGADSVKIEGEEEPDTDAMNAALEEAGITGPTISMTVKDSVVANDIRFIDDSQMGNPHAEAIVDEGGSTVGYDVYAGASDFVITFDGVTAPVDRTWAIRGGSSNSHGTVTINVTDSVIGNAETNGMRFAIEDGWGAFGGTWQTPNCASDFIFNLTDTTFNGHLLAGRSDMGDSGDDDNPELNYVDADHVGYTGARVLNVGGNVFIDDTRYFKEINLTAEDSLTGTTLSMHSAGGEINITGVEGYEGKSKVLVSIANTIANITIDDVNTDFVPEEGKVSPIMSDADETGAFSTIILKGEVKDIYVSGEYAEGIAFGQTCDITNEVLFLGENAFVTMADAIAAIPGDDSVVYVTGNVKSDAIASNSLYVDGGVKLTYSGNTAITIDGTVTVGDSSQFLIQSAGFVGDAPQDVLVLTADGIIGDTAAFRTDTKAYSVKVVENEGKQEVHLTLNAKEVYVNTAWADLAEGTEVVIDDKTFVIGLTAFADANTAAGLVAPDGTLTVLGSDVSFTNAIVRNVIATSWTDPDTSEVAYSIVRNTAIGTATAAGALTLTSGSSAYALNVRAAGTLTVESDVTVSGLGISEGATVTFAEGSTLDFDVSGQTAGGAAAVVSGFSTIVGAPALTATIDLGSKDGDYKLAADVADFASTVTLQTKTATIADLTLDEAYFYEDTSVYYTLKLNDNNELILNKKTSQSVMFIDSNWTGKAYGETVTIVGIGEATIGVNAFATGDEAVAEATDKTTFQVVGGVASFTDGVVITTTVTGGSLFNTDVIGKLIVSANGSITGNATFDDEATVTVDGTIAFDTQYAGADAPQFVGLSKVAGETKYTLTVTGEFAAGDSYMLASDAAGFDSTVSFNGVTLVVGEAQVIGDYQYMLTLSEVGDLELSIADKPAPVKPDYVYVNSEWSSKKVGDIVEIAVGGEATIGYDAFAKGDAAVAGVSDEGTITVVGGIADFSAAIAKTVLVASDATLTGKVSIAEGGSLTVNGMFQFDTAYAATAQIEDLSVIGTPLAYTLTDTALAAGTYVLAGGAAGFASEIAFEGEILTVDAEAIQVGNFTYALSVVEDALTLTVATYEPPVVTPTKAYANSLWTDKTEGETIEITVGVNATFGYDAFLSGDEAIAAVTDDGTIEVVGGVASFENGVTKETAILSGATILDSEISSVLTVNDGAILTGNITALEGASITVNGTVAFDTAYAAEGAQIVGFSAFGGDATYTLTDSVAVVGSYLLATDAAGFDKTIAFGDQTLTVGAEAITVGGLDYALTLDAESGSLTLEVTEYVPEYQAVVYVNSDWTGKSKGDEVKISDEITATIGVDAFADADTGYLTTADDGELFVVGGVAAFDKNIAKTITVTSDAALTGKVIVIDGGSLTVNGTFVFDTAYATAAQIADLTAIEGAPTYTLVDSVLAEGTYILAGNAAGFAGSIDVNGQALTVDSSIVDGDFTYALSVVEDALTLTVATYIPPVIVPTQAYVNSLWTDKQEGDTVVISDEITATIGYDAFTTGDAAITAVTEDGAVTVVGGDASFTDAIAKTVTVTSDATLTGKVSVAEGGSLTVEGTFEFDTALATQADLSQILGNASYTLVDSVKTAGVYVLATGATGFDKGITFGNAVLTVGGGEIIDGSLTYALSLSEDALTLTVDDYVPPVVTPTIAYVNTDWADKQAGDVVDVLLGGKATIGYDAFVTGDAAMAAVTDDGAVSVIKGEVKFTNPIAKTLTLSADSTLIEKATFTDGVSITVNGTIAFDTAYTVDGAQFTGLSNVSGATKYTLNAAAVAGTYRLATGAAGFNSEVQLGDYTLTVGQEQVIGDFTYTLKLGETTNILSLEIAAHTEPINGPDDGWNNWLYEKKGRGENATLVNMVVDPLNYDSTIVLDQAGTVLKPADDTVYHNFVGSVDGFKPEDRDEADYTKIVLETGAQLEFSIDSQIAGKFIIYSYDESSKKMKALVTTKVKVKNGVPVKNVLSKAKLLEAGTYYISMQGTLPKAGKGWAPNGFYDVELGSATKFFLDDDNGWNSYLFEKGKNGRGLNEAVAGKDAPVENLSRASKGELVQIDADVVEHDPSGKFENFVGFGDNVDYVKIHLDTAANLSLTLESDKAAKIQIYALTYKNDVVNGSKALVTSSLKAGKGSVTSKAKVLDAGDYYIAVTSTNAKKGDEAYYNVKVSDQSVFFDNVDDGTNNWLYTKNDGVNTKLINSTGITIVDTLKNVQIDENVPTGEAGDWKNFVGYGDSDDYQKIVVSKAGATVSFKVDAKDQAKFVIYSFDTATNKMKALQTSKLKKSGDIYSITTATYTFKEAGEYYIAVTSTNAKKGGNAYYNVELASTSLTSADLVTDLSMPSLDMDAFASADNGIALQNDLNFGQSDAAAFASGAVASIDSLQEQSDWQNIAKLA